MSVLFEVRQAHSRYTDFTKHRNKMEFWLRKIREKLSRPLGNQCLLCDGLSKDQICSYCQRDIEFYNAQKFSSNLLLNPDIAKRIKHKYFEHFLALAPYQWPMSYFIQQLKYQQKYGYAPLLAELFCEKFATQVSELTDILLVPVPMSNSRRGHRGYNHSFLIGKQIAHLTGLPLSAALLKKKYETPPQVGLSRSQRARNLKNTFEANDQLSANHIILVDDVVSTGSTVDEIAKTLKIKGTEKVSVWAICFNPGDINLG